MPDTVSLFVALLIILIWVTVRFLLPKIINARKSNDISIKDEQRTKKPLLVRMAMVTSLLLIFGITLVLVTDGIGHENNRQLIEIMIIGIALIWIVGFAALRHG